MIEVAITSPEDSDARTLLAEYLAELARRLPEGVDDLSPSWNPAHFGERGAVFVARDGAAALGCAGLRRFDCSIGELKHFYVAPKARRRGVGRALLEKVEAVARELGYRKLVLDTAAPLNEAEALYRAAQYATVAPFNANPHAALWFEKSFALDDHALWGAFTHASLPANEWSHRAHLRTAFLHLARFALDEAHLRMRAGILRLNAANGVEESATRGYHETVTRAWLVLIAHARANSSLADSEALLATHPHFLDKSTLLAHYSRERINSVHARAIFVPPDLLPLPESLPLVGNDAHAGST